ncbi:tetraprenyl-beta-curcumene synthase family protein [Paenibacillus rhizovicinus]|uniref:Tetraprenyl-beta-curcumene synthase family protein n=1 Tax=Paenibacillus rhizovicinus TaxID=2704463 RepID=A0A6C0NWL7_9BACL|nr:tetraprenyl-beta-curcumene synthase family protein [Paenibacillus rhizovicinus]QHW30597.1 tetraprenyl-beta-curcumene synthase family protein [Paenibacillus rhizovicinus]
MNKSAQARQLPKTPVTLMYRVYKYVLPEVRAELARLRVIAERIPDHELRVQALASMTSKQFHCEGGGIYAAGNLKRRHLLVPLIVCLQTISDYLDNLCDRSTSLDPGDFRLLHQSMLDAVNPDAPLQDYYALRAERDDGGYLHELVHTCQACVKQLPAYALVQSYVTELVGLYGDLQVYKHIVKEKREPALLAWWEQHRHTVPQLQWNEFAAATGSTLGMFMLFLTASDELCTPEDALRVRNAYFPHVCGLHILLDYLIDQEEDRIGGDLNFCNYYSNQSLLIERIGTIVEWARKDVDSLPAPRFHRMVIEGLIALYLSDPKVSGQKDVKLVSKRLMRRSPLTRLFFWGNSVVIRKRQSSN